MGQLGAVGSVADGSATQPADHQQIIAAQYVNSHLGPIVKGGDVTGRGDLRYAVSPGVGLCPTTYGAVFVNWGAVNTALVTTPSAPRTDVIYADQKGNIHVATEGSVPTGVCIIDKRRISAGATTTTNAASVWNKRYALPYGAQLGWLAMHVENYAQGEPVQVSRVIWTQKDFFVPTDRHVQLRMHQCIYGEHNASAPSTDFSQFGMGSMKYFLYLDGNLYREWEIGYSRVWEVKMHNVDMTVNAGTHTIRLERQKVWGVADPFYFGSPNNIWQPGSVGIHDEGVAE